MQLKGNSILITGGASGIGLALAKRFVAHGNKVIICGRRSDVLEEAKRDNPTLITIACNLSEENERSKLAERVAQEHPDLNVLINNAGIQNRPNPIGQSQSWSAHSQEIRTNLEAPIHLTLLLTPLLQKQPIATIINVTSGLAFIPLAFMPTYCATKAALHSFTTSLRYQLRDSQIQVVELAPPAVNTDLGGKGLHDFGVNLDQFADAVFERLGLGEQEIGYQFSETARLATREERQKIFISMNENFNR